MIFRDEAPGRVGLYELASSTRPDTNSLRNKPHSQPTHALKAQNYTRVQHSHSLRSGRGTASVETLVTVPLQLLLAGSQVLRDNTFLSFEMAKPPVTPPMPIVARTPLSTITPSTDQVRFVHCTFTFLLTR